VFWQVESGEEQSKLDEFIDKITIRAGHSLIRFYLHEIHPEKLKDDVWCESVLDVWLYRQLESKELEKAGR